MRSIHVCTVLKTLNLRALGHITHRLRSIQVIAKGVDYVIKRKISPLFPTFLLLIFENIYFVHAVPVRESLLSSGRPVDHFCLNNRPIKTLGTDSTPLWQINIISQRLDRIDIFSCFVHRFLRIWD